MKFEYVYVCSLSTLALFSYFPLSLFSMNADGFKIVVGGRFSREKKKQSSWNKKPYKKPSYKKDEIHEAQNAMMRRASQLSMYLDERIQDVMSDSPYDKTRQVILPEGITDPEVMLVKEVYEMRPYMKVSYDLDQGVLTLLHQEEDGGVLRFENAVYDRIDAYKYSHAWLVEVPCELTETAKQSVLRKLKDDKYGVTVDGASVFVCDSSAFR